ncbi:MAG TPA: VWA domain-containing protein, partial [Ktedonobacterales bacterium]
MADIELTQRDRERGQQLQRKLVEFGRLLWDMGLDVGPGRLIEASETLGLIDVRNREDFYHALKCSLLSRHEQEPLFEQAFFYFWQLKHRLSKTDGNARVQSNDQRSGKPLRLPPRERQELEAQAARLTRQLLQGQRETGRARPEVREDKSGDEENDDAQGTAYSAIELLRRKDFESYTWEEMQEAKRLMAEMHWHLGERPTRRKAPSRKGDYPDLRRIIRRNMKYGAEFIELTWRKTRRKPRPLIIICDISGSMSLYSRLLLQFIHTISNGLQNTEAFVFGTRLTRITRQLRKRDV